MSDMTTKPNFYEIHRIKPGDYTVTANDEVIGHIYRHHGGRNAQWSGRATGAKNSIIGPTRADVAIDVIRQTDRIIKNTFDVRFALNWM